LVAISQLEQVSTVKKLGVGGGGLLLFEDFRPVGSAFRAGIIATSAAGGAINSGFHFTALISCFSFAKSFFASRLQSESSAFRFTTTHWTFSTVMPVSAIAVRRAATSDSTRDVQSIIFTSLNAARSNRPVHDLTASSV
jgi:hypothetical protein